MNQNTIKVINKAYKNYGNKLYIYDEEIKGIIDYKKINFILPIHIIICSNNYITELLNIPDSIILLECKNNKIKKFENLPVLLEKLLCDYNEITNLDNLPQGLKFLSCDDNNIISLNNLPFGLEYLSCCSNPIESLENLPFTLKKLYVYNCKKLKSLDFLPDSIDELNCDDTMLDISKYNLPSGFNFNTKFNQFGIKKK
jgi:hypothetical protein